jgi:hypothetical protein
MLGYIRATTNLSADGGVARRPARLCPLVAGASAEVNTYVASRIRQVGQEVGVDFEKKACQPNLLVLFSREPDVMLKKARKRGAIRYDQVMASQMDRFKADTRPVRWLNTIREVPTLGLADVNGDPHGPDVVRGPGTRIVTAVASQIQGSIVVVDAVQADGVEIGALADYLSMVSLSNIKPGASAPGQASIMNLFAGETPRARSMRLTPIDKAYLHGIYKVRADISGMNQMGAVARIMADELER